MRSTRGGVKQAVEYVGLEFWGESRTGDLNSRVSTDDIESHGSG